MVKGILTIENITICKKKQYIEKIFRSFIIQCIAISPFRKIANQEHSSKNTNITKIHIKIPIYRHICVSRDRITRPHKGFRVVRYCMNCFNIFRNRNLKYIL